MNAQLDCLPCLGRNAVDFACKTTKDENKRHAIVILRVSAAFITPSGDPFTLMLVFIPLYVLFELSLLVVKDKEDNGK